MSSLDWMDHGLCVGHPNPDIFFPGPRGTNAKRVIDEAKRVCAKCPVRPQCGEHRGRTGATAGVWGGAQ